MAHRVNAGFTPFQAIRIGTRNAAESIDRLDEFGTIAVGRRAALILLDENPLEDVRNIKKDLERCHASRLLFFEDADTKNDEPSR